MSGHAPMVLHAEMADVRPLARLLRGIGMKSIARVCVLSSGFQVTVEEGQTLNGSSYVPHTLFRNYQFHPPPLENEAETLQEGNTAVNSDEREYLFEVSLDAWLNCLNIFGDANASAPSNGITFGSGRKREWAGESNRFGDADEEGGIDHRQHQRSRGKGERSTSLSLDWQGPGYPLVLLLLQDAEGPVTRCELKTLEPEEPSEIEFDAEEMVLQVIMKSSWFREALMDLPPSCSEITLLASPVEDHADNASVFGGPQSRKKPSGKEGVFRMHAIGTFGHTELDYPNDISVIETFLCKTAVNFGYHASHFALLAKALHQSTKVSIRIDSQGTLSVQGLMPPPEGMPRPQPGDSTGVIEFKMQALEDNEESS